MERFKIKLNVPSSVDAVKITKELLDDFNEYHRESDLYKFLNDGYRQIGEFSDDTIDTFMTVDRTDEDDNFELEINQVQFGMMEDGDLCTGIIGDYVLVGKNEAGKTFISVLKQDDLNEEEEMWTVEAVTND